MIGNMKPHTMLSAIVCAMSMMATSLSYAQGLRVPGSSSFGNDWRLGSPQGSSSGYGSNSDGASTYGSPADNNSSRQYGSRSSTDGSMRSGSTPGTGNIEAGSSGGNTTESLRPAQPLAPRSPGGGLRTN